MTDMAVCLSWIEFLHKITWIPQHQRSDWWRFPHFKSHLTFFCDSIKKDGTLLRILHDNDLAEKQNIQVDKG